MEEGWRLNTGKSNGNHAQTEEKKQCCGSGSGIRCLFDPWIRDGQKVSIRIRDRDEQPGSYFLELRNHFFWVKILIFFDADPGSGMVTVLIRDPGWKKVGPGSGINNPGSATLEKSLEKRLLCLVGGVEEGDNGGQLLGAPDDGQPPLVQAQAHPLQQRTGPLPINTGHLFQSINKLINQSIRLKHLIFVLLSILLKQCSGSKCSKGRVCGFQLKFTARSCDWGERGGDILHTFETAKTNHLTATANAQFSTYGTEHGQWYLSAMFKNNNFHL